MKAEFGSRSKQIRHKLLLSFLSTELATEDTPDSGLWFEAFFSFNLAALLEALLAHFESLESLEVV